MFEAMAAVTVQFISKAICPGHGRAGGDGHGRRPCPHPGHSPAVPQSDTCSGMRGQVLEPGPPPAWPGSPDASSGVRGVCGGHPWPVEGCGAHCGRSRLQTPGLIHRASPKRQLLTKPHSRSEIRISRRARHALLNFCFHTALTFTVFAGGINRTKHPVLCQAVSAAGPRGRGGRGSLLAPPGTSAVAQASSGGSVAPVYVVMKQPFLRGPACSGAHGDGSQQASSAQGTVPFPGAPGLSWGR